MSTVDQHHRRAPAHLDVDIAWGMVFAAAIAFVAMILQQCSSMLANLPHQG